MPDIEISFVPNVGNLSAAVAISTTSAQSVVFSTRSESYVNLFSTADMFMRMGLNPVALSTGVDQFIPANNTVRISPIPANFRLAFITASGTGTVYVTDET